MKSNVAQGADLPEPPEGQRRRRQAKTGPAGLVHIGRDDFVKHYFDYRRGQHVTILAPTQNGKTTLGFQLLGQAATPELPAVVLVIKPRDPTVATWGGRLGFRRVREWPPRRYPKPPGWLLWPPHSYDTERDDDAHRATMRHAITDCYRRGNRIIFCDELWGLEEIGLRKDVERVLTRGAGMGCGSWQASQRPFAITQAAYSQAEHLFLGPTPDKRDRDRYREIGGVDADMIQAAVLTLERYQFLHIQRAGPTLCVVDAH